MIKLENVCFEVSGSVILNKICFEAAPKEAKIIYYDEGSGATTLAKILCGLKQPTSGNALIKNNQITPQNINASLLLSKPIYFKHKTVLKNLLKSAKVIKFNASQQQALSALKNWGINQKQKVGKMAQVQKLMFSFARSEFFGKNVVIADDIFRNLTSEEMQSVLPVFISFIKGKTAIIFDSTKKLDLENAKKYYLSMGALYPFEKNPRLWQIYCMQENPKSIHSGTIVDGGIKENETIFKIRSKEVLKAKERGVEKVLFSTCKNKVVAIFDAMDFERIL